MFQCTTVLRPARTGALLIICAVIAPPRPAGAIVTAGPPDDFLAPFGGGLDGVAKLFIDTSTASFLCSGALLPTGRHVLTAAHCVTDAWGRADLVSFAALFETPGVIAMVPGRRVLVNPAYTGDLEAAGDLAVVTLAEAAPAGANRYPVYRGDGDLGRVGLLAGYGAAGRGKRDLSIPGDFRRAGWNRLEADGNAFGFPGGGRLLVYDFDNGKPANDALGIFAGLHDTGEGWREALPSYGDSGGPSFLDGALAGIHSFGFRAYSKGKTSDVDGLLNQSFGEFGADVRLSRYAAWIDRATIPEPAIGAALLLGCALLAAVRRWAVTVRGAGPGRESRSP